MFKTKETKLSWSPDTLKLMRHRRNVYKKAKKQKSKILFEKANKLKKTITKKLRAEKSNKINNLLKNESPKSLWDTVKMAIDLPIQAIPSEMNYDGKFFFVLIYSLKNSNNNILYERNEVKQEK